MPNPLPHAFYQARSKRGSADCAIAAMAMIFRRDPEEILIVASRICPTVWHAGLSAPAMHKTARRLHIKTQWVTRERIDPDSTGVLWINYHDSTKSHAVALIDGLIVDPEYDPPVICAYDEYVTAMNAYGSALLVVKE